MKILFSRAVSSSLSALTISAFVLSPFAVLVSAPLAFADSSAVTTELATNVTSTDATLNGTNGATDASGHSFWVSLAPAFDTSTSNIPAGVYSTPDLGAISAGSAFTAQLSSVPGLPAITANTAYYFVAWSNINGTWSPGTIQTFTTGPTPALAAQDFGVMNVSGVKGYTAGFGLTGASLVGATSIVTQLYSGTTLLQTDTASNLSLFSSFTQFSSPFDVSGTFNYPADGYWTNVRGAEYGQTLIPTKVVATVTLADGSIVTAENDTLTGDPATIMPAPVLAAPVLVSPANGSATTTLGQTGASWASVTDVAGGITYVFQSSTSSSTNPDGSFATPAYTSPAQTALSISTAGTPTGTYYWHVQATDANSIASAWSVTSMFTVDNTGATGTIGGGVTGGQSATGDLAVTSVTAVQTSAIADGTFTNGWKYLFNITVPTDETNLSMKFADWMSTVGSSIIPVAGNMRISSAQADNAGATVLLTAANTYATPALHMTGDLNSSTPGLQVQIEVDAAVPPGSVNGAYTTSYGVQTLP